MAGLVEGAWKDKRGGITAGNVELSPVGQAARKPVAISPTRDREGRCARASPNGGAVVAVPRVVIN